MFREWCSSYELEGIDVFCSISDNSIPAIAFKEMKAPFVPGEREENETNRGLRIADKGFLNTAVLRSEITYIDGEAGGVCLAVCLW